MSTNSGSKVDNLFITFLRLSDLLTGALLRVNYFVCLISLLTATLKSSISKRKQATKIPLKVETLARDRSVQAGLYKGYLGMNNCKFSDREKIMDLHVWLLY